jgi:hypothetical protein
MNPDLLYKFSEYQHQDRMNEACLARLAKFTGQCPFSIRALVALANSMISAGQRLQTYALDRAYLNTSKIQ